MATCKFCGFDALRERVAKRTVPFDDGEIVVEVRSSVCSQCNRPQVTPEQDKANKRAINEAKRLCLGIPSRAELRKLRARWKMTQAAAGKLLGVGPTAFSKYENGEVLPAAPTARLLNVISSDDGAMLSLVNRYGDGVKLTVPTDLSPVRIVSSSIAPVVNIHVAAVFLSVPVAEASNLLDAERYSETAIRSAALPLTLAAPSTPVFPQFPNSLTINAENPQATRSRR
ncbi:type II TA system antitoxin MqsA family protein [Burkholderia vietnamiensis]|uniref:type II TA system antitoxin MqsA family protein n=1 Tax=Burkholderia vietnamiensis TaxID=60552 RepID=UPI001589AAED|nr:type II toxin-antitoxin system MqsA family antitoxin [Burkholderia vietnamiensis]